MDLKLNNSELNTLLTMIDDSLGYDLEPLERATLMSIVNKINGGVRSPVNRCVEEFAMAIRDTNYEEAI